MRTFISKVNSDGTIRGAYYEGEVDGTFLNAHYIEPAKLDALVQLNDIITLAEDPANTTSYSFEPKPEGEDFSQEHIYSSNQEALGRISAERCFMFQDGTWTVYTLVQPGLWSVGST